MGILWTSKTAPSETSGTLKDLITSVASYIPQVAAIATGAGAASAVKAFFEAHTDIKDLGYPILSSTYDALEKYGNALAYNKKKWDGGNCTCKGHNAECACLNNQQQSALDKVLGLFDQLMKDLQNNKDAFDRLMKNAYYASIDLLEESMNLLAQKAAYANVHTKMQKEIFELESLRDS